MSKIKKLSSANNLHSLLRPFPKPLTYIKIKTGFCDTPAQMSPEDEHWQFKINLCFLLVKKSFCILIKHLNVSFWCSLQANPGYQTLSKALEMLRNNRRTSRPMLKSLRFSCLINSSWLIQESPGVKPECFEDFKPFS